MSFPEIGQIETAIYTSTILLDAQIGLGNNHGNVT
jgi:hypothetical protein